MPRERTMKNKMKLRFLPNSTSTPSDLRYVGVGAERGPGGEGRATQPHFQQRLLISVAVCAAGPAACSRLMPPPARHEPSPQ